MDIALAIHVLRMSRQQLLANAGLVLLTAIGYLAWLPSRAGGETNTIIRCYPMAASLALALYAFHFTEGTRRAGFGTYPARLFVLPVSSFRLVVIPMALGVMTVVGLYLVWARLILPLVHVHLDLLWPCLFLVCWALNSYS